MTALYLNEQQTIVKKRDDYLVVQYPDRHTVEVPLIKVTQVIVSGDITLTTPELHTLLAKGIEVCYMSMYGQYRGRLSPPLAKNAFLPREQYRRHADPQPALALDLMEEFRPIVADSVVLNIVNHRILTERDFQEELGVVHLKAEARKTFYAKFEDRLQEELQHPHFGYRTSYQRCIELQARLLGKWITGEIPRYL